MESMEDISVVNREKNNYTEWRKTMFDDMTVEEFSEAAAEILRHLRGHRFRQTALQRFDVFHENNHQKPPIPIIEEGTTGAFVIPHKLSVNFDICLAM